MSGLVFPESPRWREGRLWLSDWGAHRRGAGTWRRLAVAPRGAAWMRSVDGNYLYNMRVNVAKLNTDYTVVIYPYGTGNPGQTLRHVIQATK